MTAPATRRGAARGRRATPGWVARPQRPLASSLVLAVFVVVLAVMPFGLTDRGESIAVRTLIIAILAVGWNLMSGYGGLFSFGHAAFFGIGAYTDAYLVVEHGISPWIAMVVGAVLAAVAGTLIAYLCLRYRAGRGRTSRWRPSPSPRCSCWSSRTSRRCGKTEGFNLPILPEDSFWMMQFESGQLELLLDPGWACSGSAWPWSSASPAAASGQRVAGRRATTRSRPRRSGSA